MSARTLLLTCLCGLIFAAPARAQSDTINLHHLYLPVDGNGFVVVDGAGGLRGGDFHIGMQVGHAEKPLELEGSIIDELVERQTTIDLVFAYGIFDWLNVGLDLPIVANNKGIELKDFNEDVNGQGLGALRLQAKVTVLGAGAREGFQLAVQPFVTFPTGNGDDYLSDNDQFTGGFNVLATFRVGRFRAGGSFGYEWTSSDISLGDLNIDDRIRFGVAAEVFLLQADPPAGAPGLEESNPPLPPPYPNSDKAPTDEAPADEAPADEAPADDAPADDAPAEEAPANEAPAEDAPADEAAEQEQEQEAEGGNAPPPENAGAPDAAEPAPAEGDPLAPEGAAEPGPGDGDQDPLAPGELEPAPEEAPAEQPTPEDGTEDPLAPGEAPTTQPAEPAAAPTSAPTSRPAVVPVREPFRHSLSVGAELFGWLNARKPFSESRDRPIEMLGTVRYRHTSGLSGQVGAGAGLTDGVGSPDFRFTLGFGWSF